jgi:hypothetical protein
MKQTTRKALGPLYPLLMRAKGSPAIVGLRSLGGAVPWHRARARQAVGVVDLNTPVGMGALLCHALLLHSWFGQQAMAVHVQAVSPLYSAAGEDVFARFFERPPAPAGAPLLGRWATDYLIAHVRPDHMPLARAQELFARHFRPSAELRAAIAAATPVEAFDLSIHFRGTDKFLESGLVGHEPMFAAIRAELAGRTTARVFLATDDAAFARALKAEFPGLDCTSYDLGEVESGLARHFSDLSPTDKALEALVNIFLIARAPVCVRTSSYMSAVSALVNPALRTVTINRTIAGKPPFPEAEVLAHEAARAG